MKAAVALAVLLSPGLAQAADIALGPLTLVYDAARWEATAADDGAVLRCTADGCAPTPVVFAVRTDGGASCSDEAMYPALAAAFPDAPYHGANPHVIGNLVLWLGLAGHGPLLTDPDAVRGCVAHRACVMHEGRAHLIETPDAGCRTHIEVPLEAVRALAEGARLSAPR